MISEKKIVATQTDTLAVEDLVSLYDSVGWLEYTQDTDLLLRAIEGSDFVVEMRDESTLVELAGAISDDASIVYIQDILVRPEYQGQGLGKALVRSILDRYDHVRQKVLLTDDNVQQLEFYRSLGFHNTKDLIHTPLTAFVQIEGVK